ncbi:hypothetical protein KUC41_04105 [Pseudomonas aeruginosa]|uniref:hypothetical protein n=1 Tax=Pseudomonas aeruginosa TaxID=287 RepID=UPI0021E2BD12|nr:hypothetical protein [Pseudomonas aeruginosa]MCV0171156.1 hypothetical protein [Pseudomonas aeruginosa]
MTKANECTCPSGDGSLVHPCPAHPAVEQAGANVGHGHVLPRADGVKMRCGGPGLCSECTADASRARAALAQPSPTLPPFAKKVLAKLRRFYDCAEDFESGGVDIGRHWLDLLTQLGLLNRVQRSPALWEISQQGEDLLGTPHPSPAQAEKAEAERPEVVAWQYRVTAGPQTGWSLWHPGKGEEFERSYTVERRPLMTVAQYDRIVGELRAVIAQLRQHKNDYMDSGQETYRALQNEIREREAEIARLDGLVSGRTAERDAALAEVNRLRESKGDPSGSFDRCMRMMYERDENAKRLDAALAKIAELEAKLSDPTAVHQWQFSNAWFDGSEENVLKAGKEGSPIRTLYAAPVAQAQHSVPETTNEEANSFLRVADAGQFKDNAVAVRTAAVIIRSLLHRPALMQSIIRHRIGLTPEYEGQWHADLYGEDGEVQHHAEADTPDEAVRAVVALAAAPGKEGA